MLLSEGSNNYGSEDPVEWLNREFPPEDHDLFDDIEVVGDKGAYKYILLGTPHGKAWAIWAAPAGPWEPVTAPPAPEPPTVAPTPEPTPTPPPTVPQETSHARVAANGDIIWKGEVLSGGAVNAAIWQRNSDTLQPGYGGGYVFTGLQLAGRCVGAQDTSGIFTDGCYPGGGFNSAQVWDSHRSDWVTVPDRHHYLAGPWAQKAIRITTRARPAGGGEPTERVSAEDTIRAVEEAIAHGLIAIIETHDLTESDADPAQYRPGVLFWERVCDHFAGNPYVWFNFMNEPTTKWTGSSEWKRQAEFWVRFGRERADNVIVLDLGDWGQNLRGLAEGDIEGWRDHMKANGLWDDRIVMSWHAYGANSGIGGYTYEAAAAHLQAVKDLGYGLIVGEFGEAAQIGTGNAGPDEWNRTAVDILLTDKYGEPLADRFNLLCAVWHATGDATSWHTYKPAQGAHPSDPDGPIVPGVNGMGLPLWWIDETNLHLLERLGRAHWDFSHRHAVPSTPTFDPEDQRTRPIDVGGGFPKARRRQRGKGS